MPRSTSFGYTVRPARRADAPGWLRLVSELAVFEKLKAPTPAARRRLIRDAFGPKPRIFVYVATHKEKVVGYVILVWTYSSFLAKPTLWIEDIYLGADHRGKGLADVLLHRIAEHARKGGAGRIDGIVLDWNHHAQNFYHRTGADLKREWILLRYDETTIKRLAKRRVRA